MSHVAGDKYFKKNLYSFLRKIKKLKFTKIKNMRGSNGIIIPGKFNNCHLPMNPLDNFSGVKTLCFRLCNSREIILLVYSRVFVQSERHLKCGRIRVRSLKALAFLG